MLHNPMFRMIARVVKHVECFEGSYLPRVHSGDLPRCCRFERSQDRKERSYSRVAAALLRASDVVLLVESHGCVVVARRGWVGPAVCLASFALLQKTREIHLLLCHVPGFLSIVPWHGDVDGMRTGGFDTIDPFFRCFEFVGWREKGTTVVYHTSVHPPLHETIGGPNKVCGTPSPRATCPT